MEILEKAVAIYGKPEGIVVDNGPEFISRVLDEWAYENGIELHFVEPGKPNQNAFVESFNGKMRDECLNQHAFDDLNDARKKIEAWRQEHLSPARIPRVAFTRGVRCQPDLRSGPPGRTSGHAGSPRNPFPELNEDPQLSKRLAARGV